MKRGMCVLLTALLLGALPAQAVGEERGGYENFAQLPQEIQRELGAEREMLSGVRYGHVIFVQVKEEGDHRLLIFRDEGKGYRLECKSAVLPAFDGVTAYVDLRGSGLLYLKYEPPSTPEGWWCATFGYRPERKVWELSCVQTPKDDYVLTRFFIRGQGNTGDPQRRECFYGQLERDLSKMDVAAIPGTFASAFLKADLSRCALVTSDAEEHRVHLRTGPEESAASLGAYYSGAPVDVLEAGEGPWVQVAVGGVQGYMRRAELAFGKEMLETLHFSHSAALFLRREWTEKGIPVYDRPGSGGKPVDRLRGYTESWPWFDIMGLAGDGWFHVIYAGDKTGYVEAKYFGNE